MKVKLLSPLAKADKSHGAGEIIDLGEKEAVRFIKNKLAEPVSKKEFEKLIKKLEEEQRKKEEEEKLLKAQLEKEKLEAELNGLYAEVVEKEAELAGVVLSDEEKLRLVEELKNRETKAGNEAKNSK